MRFATVGLCAALALLAACGNSGGPATELPDGPPDPQPRSDGAPDVVVFSISGHAGGLSAIACTSDDNRPYLADAGGARVAVEQAFLDLGYTVDTMDFTDRLVAQGDDSGFDELLSEMQFVFENYIDGVENPTRIVLVGHSHGANWMHVATAAVPHIPIDQMISLDAICLLWECEHTDDVLEWLQTTDLDPLIDLSAPCDSVAVEGMSALQNVKDVVFDHVRYNIEIQSTGFVSDCCPNTRLDGSTAGIGTWRSPESHGEVDEANSDAMTWVVEQIRQIDASR